MIADSGIESGSSPEINSSQEEAPLSRTYQYRKVMKPLLERKRRARINKCLDNLKDIMVNTLQSEGESITKLEKADVLELTVKHLRKLKRQNALGLTPQATYAGRFRAGYSHCAQEVSKFMSQQTTLEIDTHASARLLSHLSGCIHALESMPPSILQMAVSPIVGGNNTSAVPSPISPPLTHESMSLPPSYNDSIPKSQIGALPNHVSHTQSSLTSLSPAANPSLLASLSKSSNVPSSIASVEYANSLARVAATAHQYSALLQTNRLSPSQTNALQNIANHHERISDKSTRAAAAQQLTKNLSHIYQGGPPSAKPSDIKLDEYQRRSYLSKSSNHSVLCGIDDKAWRPW